MTRPVTIDLSPRPRKKTSLEETVESFSNRTRENQESDALRSIYEQHQKDGQNLEATIKDIQTRPGLSPTKRVKTIEELISFQKHNNELQERTKKQVDEQRKKDANKNIIADLEQRRGLPAGSLADYAEDPKMAEQVSRPPREGKQNQADRPPDQDQLDRIEKVTSSPQWEKASLSQKQQLLMRGGVSTPNQKPIMDAYSEEQKPSERDKVLTQEQAKDDVKFSQGQAEALKLIDAQQRTLDRADELNEQGVTGGLLDQALEKVGLLQYTSDGRREYTSISKDALKNQNIKAIVGSQMSQMEFSFFAQATINPNFSKEANKRIIQKEKIALRYQKLYADITKNLIEQNGGQIPERLQDKVNAEYAKQSEKLTKELKEVNADFQAIQKVPPGQVLMYDKKRRPLHVPENEVEKYSKMGATLS
jgi:hypothetical protein